MHESNDARKQQHMIILCVGDLNNTFVYMWTFGHSDYCHFDPDHPFSGTCSTASNRKQPYG